MHKKTLVLDTNAFITGQNLLKLGADHNLYTTKSVLEEIRDVKTKKLVDQFPYKITKLQCTKANIEIVKQFAKKTGDIGSLSDVDMEVIAAAYQLYVEGGMKDKIRSDRPLTIEQYKKRNRQDITDQESEDQSESLEVIEDYDEVEITQQKQTKIQQTPKEKVQNTEDKGENDDDGWVIVPKTKKIRKLSSQQSMDEEEGWITPTNYDSKMLEINTTVQEQQNNQNQQSTVNKQESEMPISVMTADYAMQNVCTQMCIPLLSLDGRKITQIRRFIQECYLCWKKYRIEDNKIRLCKQCGYNSLSKIAYSINSKGQMILHRKKGWKPNEKVLQWKQKMFEEQERKKKHKHPRRKKQASIFDNN